jgi:phage terminase small subunit
MAGPLTNIRWEKFAQARAKGMSQVAAAVAAGYPENDSNAARLNRNERVLARIAELQAPAIRETVMTVQSLFDMMTKQGTYDPKLFQEVKSVDDLDLIPEEIRRLLIKGWKWDKQGRFMLELVDKEKALDRLARHLAFYNDTLKVQSTDYTDLLKRAESDLAG